MVLSNYLQYLATNLKESLMKQSLNIHSTFQYSVFHWAVHHTLYTLFSFQLVYWTFDLFGLFQGLLDLTT